MYHVVSHTHWDREWYLPATRFRQLLVTMIDELIDDPPTGGASFLLDGQTVVVDDYLAVRTERRDALLALVRSGALEVGPWFVQADELIPGAESLVRNLLLGRKAMAAMGAIAPPVLYCPDTFGHPAALPTLANGFGCTSIIASRGYGGARWPKGDSAWWIAPDGERVLFYHFSKSGYEAGAQLPIGSIEATDRWRAIRDDLSPRSALGSVLVMNGADHHARQAHLPAALAALADAAKPEEVRASSLTAFGDDIAKRALSRALPEISGELRDSYGWMWTLQGTFATRAHQKRRNARIERLLARDAEPWTAFAHRSGSLSVKPLTDAAWRSLILCHPHDTICGCSIDEVARAMDARLDEAETQAIGLRDDAIYGIAHHDREAARVKRDEWQPTVLVRNAAARRRGGVALLRLTSFIADVKVGMHPAAAAAPAAPRVTPAIADVARVQVLARSVEDERTESPRHYPDDDLVAVTEVAAWIPEVRGYGVRAFKHVKRGVSGDIPHPAASDGNVISNGHLSLTVGADGTVQLADHLLGRVISDLISWESVVDLGDEYTPSPRGAKFTPTFRGARVVHRGPVRAAIDTRWRFGEKSDRVDVRVRFIVDADAHFVRIVVSGDNHTDDHRLRLRIASDVTAPRVFADAMFGPVERTVPDVSPDEARMELPLRTAPLHRYVSLFADGFGATVYSDGLGEYETDDRGGTFVTLVRSVGELSRVDLPERPGNAGWPNKTPGAQCRGPFGGEFALFLHGPRSAATLGNIELVADDVLLPLTGSTLRSALNIPVPSMGAELHGDGLAVSTIKESEDGAWLVLRCVNVLDEECAGTWTLGSTIAEAHVARLDETPRGILRVDDHTIEFVAKAREVVTILAR